jgi:uncharacterized protein YodC (DUF2158 family)
MALNETEVKIGDVVRLNAGGPYMAVERIFTVDAGLLTADCVWFAPDGNCRRAEFLCCTLMVAPFPVDRLYKRD